MPFLQEGLALGKAWGFDFVNVAFVWVKTNPKKGNLRMGLGHWTRGNAELCLFFKRGKLKRQSTTVQQIVVSPLRKHSQKPDEVRKRITDLLGDLPRIELFARYTPESQHTEGWHHWGDGRFS